MTWSAGARGSAVPGSTRSTRGRRRGAPGAAPAGRAARADARAPSTGAPPRRRARAAPSSPPARARTTSAAPSRAMLRPALEGARRRAPRVARGGCAGTRARSSARPRAARRGRAPRQPRYARRKRRRSLRETPKSRRWSFASCVQRARAERTRARTRARSKSISTNEPSARTRKLFGEKSSWSTPRSCSARAKAAKRSSSARRSRAAAAHAFEHRAQIARADVATHREAAHQQPEPALLAHRDRPHDRHAQPLDARATAALAPRLRRPQEVAPARGARGQGEHLHVERRLARAVHAVEAFAAGRLASHTARTLEHALGLRQQGVETRACAPRRPTSGGSSRSAPSPTFKASRHEARNAARCRALSRRTHQPREEDAVRLRAARARADPRAAREMRSPRARLSVPARRGLEGEGHHDAGRRAAAARRRPARRHVHEAAPRELARALPHRRRARGRGGARGARCAPCSPRSRGCAATPTGVRASSTSPSRWRSQLFREASVERRRDRGRARRAARLDQRGRRAASRW